VKITAGLSVIYDHFVLGDYDRALALAQSLEKTFPKASVACFASGVILMAKGSCRPAYIKMINASALAAIEGSRMIIAHTYIDRAEIFLKAGDSSAASRWAERATEAYSAIGSDTNIYTARAKEIIRNVEAC